MFTMLTIQRLLHTKGVFTLDRIITWAVMCFLVLGGTDSLFGNRFGLGAEFEKGLETSGRLLLCMTGFLALAPVIAQVLSPVVVPLLRGAGIDPSAFAGILFANDSGGAALALKLADNTDMGRFSGLIVASMLGTTVMFNIPLCIANTQQEQHPAVVYGLLAGIITIPLGCLAGGLVAGFDPNAVLWNMIPVLMIAGILALMLIFCREMIVRLLTLLGKGILVVGVVGLIISAVQGLTGMVVLEGMASLDEIFIIIGNICIFLAGIFPLLKVIQRAFGGMLRLIGERLAINENSVSGFLLALANGISVFPLLAEMDDKGRMLNVAFLVSGSCLLGDHLAYTAQVDPSLCGALLIGKLIGGLSGILLALLLAPRLLNRKSGEVRDC